MQHKFKIEALQLKIETLQLKIAMAEMKSQVANGQAKLLEANMRKMQKEINYLKNELSETKIAKKMNETLSIELDESRKAELELLKMNEELATKLTKSQKTITAIKAKLQISELKNKAQRYVFMDLAL